MRPKLLAFCAALALLLSHALPAFAQPFSVPTDAHSASSAPMGSSSIVIEAPSNHTNSDYDFLIPVVGEIGFYFAVVGGLLATLVYRFRSDQQRLETLRDLVDKGRDVPPALLSRPSGKTVSDLKKSLVLIATGLGFTGALMIAREPRSAGFGLIPTLIGVAYYIVWRVERDRPPTAIDE